MTGLFDPPSKILIMWYCFSTERTPEVAYKKYRDFEKFKKQFEMYEKAERQKEKQEEKKK